MSINRDIMPGRLRAVVPPAGVPETLKQGLGIVFSVAIDEMDVPAQGLIEENEQLPFGVVRRYGMQGFCEITCEVEGESGDHLGLKEFKRHQKVL